jgi:hypothetical protein
MKTITPQTKLPNRFNKFIKALQIGKGAFTISLLGCMSFFQSNKIYSQSCQVNIAQTPNAAVCAGVQSTLSVSSSFLNLGTGADGQQSINSSYFTDAIRSAVVGTNNGSTKKVRVASTVGFAPGNEVLVITMVDGNTSGNLVGQYEFRNISTISGDTLIFTQNHSNSYNASSTLKHQVIKVPQFTNLIINNGGLVTCNTWNGATGGVVCFRATGNVNINNGGAISASGKGYRGLSHAALYRNYNGAQGEGIYGQGYTGGASNGSNGTWNNANGNGGGGGTGTQDAAGGAGGAYGVAGSSASNYGGHNAGIGGSVVGNNTMTGLFMGGAGGEGGADEDGGAPGGGGNGGGIVYFVANSVSLIGTLSSNGSNGGDGTNNGGGWGCGMAGGGGGAGGSVYFGTNGFSGTGSNITSIGGNGGATNGCGSNGANGGNGRIRIDMTNTAPVSNPVCYQGSVPSMAAVTYSWSNGATTSSIIVSPSVTTTYSVIITSTTGCTGSSAAAIVTINPLPSLSILGSNTICSGQMLTLTASGANTYTWSNSVINAVAFAPSSSNVYTVTGTNTLTGCANTNTFSNSVYTTPTITAIGGTICSGNSFVFNPIGANTYSYSSGSSTVSPLNTTSYTITGYSNQGCASSAVVKTVSVNATPTISVNSATICSGNNANLTASGAISYTWSNNANAANISVSPNSTSVYTVNGSSNGCNSTKTSTVVVNITPTINISNSTICEGDSYTLNPTGANTYTYSNGQVVNPIVNTTYTISGTSNQGCVSANALVTINVNASPVIALNGGTICEGQSFTLTPSGANTYTYSNGPILTPSVTSSYTVLGTSSQGCISLNPAVATIIVNANPTITALGSTICEGQSFTLSASGANTYTYSGGQVVSPTITTTYSITGTSLQGCDSQLPTLVTINVNSAPVIAVSNGAICEGQSFTLSPTGANTFTYSSGPVVTPSITSTYTINGTSSQGCDNLIPAIATITVNSNPTITANGGTICNGQSFTIQANGAFTYTYSGGQTVNPNTTSTYTVSGNSQEGCAGNDVVVTVSVNPLPNVSISSSLDTVCINQSTIALNGLPFNGVYSGNNVSDSTFTPSNSGVYYPTYTYTDVVTGCSNSDSTMIFVDNCTKLNSMITKQNAIKLYPNPTIGKLTIEFDNTLQKSISLIDITGRVILNETTNISKFNYNLSDMAKGVYFVSIKMNNEIQTFKVIKN